MKYAGFILVLIVIVSCSQQEETITYDITDIKFPGEHLRTAIREHNIAASYFYATSSITTGRPYHFKPFCDSLVTQHYDSNGNLTRDIDGYYEHNNINRLIFSNAGRCLSSTSYHVYLFHEHERILYQLSYDKVYSYEPPGVDQWGRPTNIRRLDTVIYRFDNAGRITSAVSRGFPAYEYKYDKEGKLVSAGWHAKPSEYRGPERKAFTMQYYYTKNKLDSILTIHKMFNDSVYIERDYYDGNGLLSKSIQYLKHCPYCPFYAEPLVTYTVRNINRDSL